MFETKEGFGAGWARSLRASFVAWAFRILATMSGLVFDGGGDCSTFFELGFIVLTALAGSFALEADFVAAEPSFFAGATGFAEAAGTADFLASLTTSTAFAFVFNDGDLDFCRSLSAFAAVDLVFDTEPFAGVVFPLATGAGFFAAAIFFVSFASLEAAFCADFALVIPSTDFLGVNFVVSAAFGAPLVRGLADALGDLPVFFAADWAAGVRPPPFVGALEGVDLELADFLRSVDKVAAPSVVDNSGKSGGHSTVPASLLSMLSGLRISRVWSES